MWAQDRRIDTYSGFYVGHAYGIYLFNPNNGKRRRIVHDDTARWPHFSRDGRSIVFAKSDGDNFDLYKFRVSGGPIKRLTKTPGDETEPVYLTGGRIAYSYELDREEELRVMRDDGSGSHQAASGTFVGAASSSGRKIAFEMCRQGNCDIYLYDRRAKSTRRLTRYAGRDFDPEFSPEGARIVYMSSRTHKEHPGQRRPQVWLMRADGSHNHMEGRGTGDSEVHNPIFSPTGKSLLVEFLVYYPYDQGAVGDLVVDRLDDRNAPTRYIGTGGKGILFDADWQAR